MGGWMLPLSIDVNVVAVLSSFSVSVLSSRRGGLRAQTGCLTPASILRLAALLVGARARVSPAVRIRSRSRDRRDGEDDRREGGPRSVAFDRNACDINIPCPTNYSLPRQAWMIESGDFPPLLALEKSSFSYIMQSPVRSVGARLVLSSVMRTRANFLS